MRGDQSPTKPQRFERAVPPGKETLVTVETMPGAVCQLSHESNSEHSLRLDADDHRIVRFHARAPMGVQPIELILDCAVEGAESVRHTVALRADVSARPQVAGPPGVPTGPLLEPLSGDLMALADQELVARGYPPRPDPGEHPALFAHWVKRVSRPFVQVSPRRVAHPRVGSAHSAAALDRKRTQPTVESPTLPSTSPAR